MTNQSHHFQTDHLKDDLKGRSTRGGVVTLIGQAVKFSATLGSNIILARLLTPEDYGLVGMVAVVTNFIALFKDMGLSIATIQQPKINHEQASTLFWVNVSLSSTITLLTTALAPLVAWFYGEPRLIWITIALSLGFICGGLAAQHHALLNRQMRFTTIVTIDLISITLGFVGAIALALLGFGYWTLVLMQLIMALAIAIGVWTACRWRPGLPDWSSGIGSMLAFGGNLTGFNVVNYFARNLDNMLIGWRWGAQPLGLYAKAYQLLLLPLSQINAPISGVAIPALSRLIDLPDRYRRAYLRLLEKLVIVTMPLMVLMAITSDWLVEILLGNQWSETSRIFVWLSIAGLIQPVANSTGWLFISQGRTHHMFQWGIISSAITIASFLIGLPWGAMGVARAYSLVWLAIVMPLLFWFVGRTGPVKTVDFYLTAAPALLASLSAAVGLFAFRRWVEIAHPLIGCTLAFVITVGITLFTLMLLPNGRTALQDFKEIALTMRQKKSQSPQ